MKKRLTSLALSLVMTAGSIAAVPFAGAADADKAFDPDEHLVKISDSSYQITSLDGSVSMKLFTNDSGAWCYSVDKESVRVETETLELGDIDENKQLNVSDMLSIKSLIMSGSYTERQKLIADVDKNDTVNVSDMIAIKSAIMSDRKIGTVDLVTETGNENETWVEESALGLNVDGTVYLSGAKVEDIKLTETNRTYAHMGNQSQLTDNGVNAEIKFSQGDKTFYMDARVYDNGIAFRYRVPEAGTHTVNDELTTFKLRSDLDEVWYGVNNRDYESVIESHDPKVASDDKIDAPLTAVVSGGKGYIAVQEAGVGDVYGGTNLYALGNAEYKIGTTWDSGANTKARTVTGEFATGWRLISIASTLDELVNNYNVYHVNEAADEELYADTSWIQPGRSAWSWLTDYGATLDTPAAMYEFTLNAARLGFEYNVIDEGYRRSGWGDSNAALADLGLFGESVGVKQLLWASYSGGHSGFRMTNVEEAKAYLDFLKEAHLYGGKIDFWDSEEKSITNSLQHRILEMAAERELIVDFHGCNKPGGIDATYPNELSREAVRGLENIGASANANYTTQASWLTRQLFTRYLSGHADWTPACNTAMQMASVMMIDSPLNVIATHPKDILANPAVEMIKSIPTVWDSTKVLSNSKIGSKAIYAKNSGRVWYLGGIYAEYSEHDEICLDEFLENGNYMVEMWRDNTNENGTNTQKSVFTVNADDILQIAHMAAGGGFIARITKLSLSQYGGEINKPVEITTADKSSVVKYTTDGSDPAVSSTAKVYSAPITLSETCELRAAITDGDGKGTEVSANFNYITVPYLEESIEYADGKSIVSFVHNSGAEIKYTTDGSDPAVSSTAKAYTGAFDVTEITTVKAVAVTEGKEPVSVSFGVYVMVDEVPLPDLYIGSDYVSGKTDWGNIHVDEGMDGAGSKPTLGGVGYDKGIAANAKATIVYNIPAGAEKFVGIVGIDDDTYSNNQGAQASATLTVSFDGQEIVTTPVFRRGDYYNVAVNVPEGAKQITIFFGNADDGNTCDHVSLVNAGWVMDKSQGLTISYDMAEKKGFTTLSLSPNFTGTLYYTTDGSDPTTGSSVYSGTLTITSACTVKVLGVPDNGGENVTLAVEVPVEEAEIAPDVYLASADLVGTPTTGWDGDPASIDKNTKGNTISIAGIEYAHGISTNANGQFVFRIPENAVKFVGVVGVDDCTYDNKNDGHKASITCSIYFDNSSTATYASAVIKQGGFEIIDIDVPEGATTIKIVFGDAGDGITCDNASLGNGGWVIG